MKKNNTNINLENIIDNAEVTALAEFKALAESATFNRDSLETLVTAFNSLADEEKTVDNFKHLETAVEYVNGTYKSDVLLSYEFLNNAELINALCTVSVEYDSKKDEPKKVANLVKNAVSYDVVRLAEEDGNIILKDGKKALIITDVLDAKTAQYTRGHADGVQTDEDVTKAKADIINGNTKGILYCAMNTACQMNNITDTKVKTNAEFHKVYNALQEFFKSQGKENPFAKTSNRSIESQLLISVGAVVGNTLFDDKCNTAYGKMLYNMLVTTNTANGLQVVCQDIFKALQCFIIVCRYMYNDIAPMIQINKTIHTTK